MAWLIISAACTQDLSPLQKYHIWLPMTGMSDAQIEDARQAGYDTVMLKIHPPLVDNRREIDFSSTDDTIKRVTDRGMNVLLAILGWVGLGNGQFWDVEEDGSKIMNQLDPFWPKAMEQVEWYYTQVINRYKTNPRVVGFAPTWGIYGEAGFTSQSAGRSEHCLARFNEWRAKQGLPKLSALPDNKSGPNTEFNHFVRFRYVYLEAQFDAMVRRLKIQAGKLPVGMWQELYPIVGCLWTMVEVPAADFALYESCFPFQTNHYPEKSLAETMGFRYRCKSPEQYRDYYLPLLARKRGEGQRFTGCQLTNDYAKNYGWTEEEAAKMQFDRYEDEFSPHLKKLMDAPLESPKRDVLLVFPTYSAAALDNHPCHQADAFLIDILLRSYGCQMIRCGTPYLDKMSIADMDKFRLIVVPEADFLLKSTWERLKRTTACVLLTGCFAKSLDGELVPFGSSRDLDGLRFEYYERTSGKVATVAENSFTKGLKSFLNNRPVMLSADQAFRVRSAYASEQKPADFNFLPTSSYDVHLSCDGEPLISTVANGRIIFIHGHIFASLCYNPNRVPPVLGGSKDASANEFDMWGLYDSGHPQNAFGYVLMKSILDWAKVDYRIPHPKSRGITPYLGDHMEPASISANIAYNNTAEPQTLTVRLPFKPRGSPSRLISGRYETRVTIPPFSYAALQPYSTF